MSDSVKLWHDDGRRPPDESWTWARTNQEAISILLGGNVTECSLDHDLVLEKHNPDSVDPRDRWDKVNDGKQLVIAMIALNLVPPKVTIHSQNPPGAAMMAAWLRYEGHDVTVAPYSNPEVQPENGYFAGEDAAGRWRVFEVGEEVANFASESEAVVFIEARETEGSQ